MSSARGLSFTAAMRMIDRVHGHASHGGPLPKPAGAARFADRDVLVIQSSDLSDRGIAVEIAPCGFRPMAF